MSNRLAKEKVRTSVLLETIPKTYKDLTGNIPTRRFNKHLKDSIPVFLSQSPTKKGLPIGSPASYALSGIFMLGLDIRIKNPFLRQTDDYLVFCKNKNEPEEILREIVCPKLKELELELNYTKLQSGKFHKDKVNFIGFEYYSGHITIKKEKIIEFKRKIIEITRLTRKKTDKTIIKLLNNKIIGFGHYYKFAECKKTFEELDAFTRIRLRRYLSKNKELRRKEGNLVLTNEILKNIGLKSLLDIKERYALKKRVKSRKLGKIETKTGQKKSFYSSRLIEVSLKYQQKQMLTELKELTTLARKLEKKIDNIENKLVK